MTLRGKDGFIIGLGVSLISILIVSSNASFPFRDMTISLSIIIAGLVTLTAIGINAVSYFQRGSVLSPAGDGFVFGFVLLFDIISVVGAFASGKLPTPFTS